MEITEIKSRLPITQVLAHYNLAPDRNGRLLCPWHNDKTPSLQIYAKTNTWTCFSSKCDAGSGDVIDFIMRMETSTGSACSKHEAILKAKGMITGHQANGTPKPKASELLVKQAVMRKFYKSFSGVRSLDNEGSKYLAGREIDAKELGIIFCPKGSMSNWRKNKDWLASIEKYGLDRFRGCVVFAMRDQGGQIVDLYGRRIDNTADQRHYFLNGPNEGLYPRWPQENTRQLILTESHIDTATLWQHVPPAEGTAYAAMHGTKGFTDHHAAAIGELEHLEEVILFFDGDQAGEDGITLTSRKIQGIRTDLRISRVHTPKQEDINSLAVNHPDQADALLQELIDKREVIFSSTEFSTEEENTQPQMPESRLEILSPELLQYSTGELYIVILGGIKITGLDKLRVTLKIELKTASHSIPIRQSLDLYHGRQVDNLIERMSEDLELSTTQSRQVISDLTGVLEDYRTDRLELLKPREKPVHELTQQEKATGLSYLKDPKLLENTRADLRASGIIGEQENALIGHIIYMSRKREKPLHVMYLGSSGSGKTHLQESLAALIPPEDKEEATSLSDQALMYEGNKLKGKVLFIEDFDGAENVQYLIRELQSKGRIVKKVAWRDAKGHTTTITIVAEGPLVISSCTTREKVYEDNANRCILLYIDESSDQDARVMAHQKKKSAGKIKRDQEQNIQRKHQNIQRLLRSIEVVNPYAEFIDLPQSIFKPKRSLPLLLSFIETITFYHQYQREIKTHPHTGVKYIQSNVADHEWAFKLLRDVLFAKSDELTKATRTFLERLKKKVKPGEVFYTQQIRKAFRISSSTIHRYMRELKTHGYISYKGGNRKRGYEYQIADYQEYETLKSDIDQKLAAILEDIKARQNGKLSIPCPTSIPLA